MSTETTGTTDAAPTTAVAPPGADGDGGRTGVRAWLDRHGWVVPTVVVGLAVALPLRGVLRAPGAPMEEGFMIVFPERLLRGDIPNRDYLHLYGPGSIWTIAAVFKAFGVSMWTERVVGLLQLVGLVAATTYVGYRWGRYAAALCGVVTAVIIIPPIGATALAWVGRGPRPVVGGPGRPRFLDGVDRRRTLAVAGPWPGPPCCSGRTWCCAWAWGWACCSCGLWTAPAAGGWCWAWPSASAPTWCTWRWRGRGTWCGACSSSPCSTSARGAGCRSRPCTTSTRASLNCFRLPGLPVAVPDAAPADADRHLVLGAGGRVRCAGGHRRVVQALGQPHGWRLLALALFATGLLPQVVQRVDTAHLSWVSCVPFGLLPAFLAEAARLRGTRVAISRTAMLAPLALLFLFPHFTYRWYADYVAQSVGYDRVVYSVDHRGRSFYYGRQDVPVAAEAMLDDVEALTEPGDRVIVGPGDLRRTPYSEAYLYYLLPDLTPGTATSRWTSQRRGLRPGRRAAGRRRRDPVDHVRQLGRAQHVDGPRLRRSPTGSSTSCTACTTATATTRRRRRATDIRALRPLWPGEDGA